MASTENARKFLEKVSSDPADREAVEADPVGELGKHGFSIDPKDVPPEGIKLPSDEAIRKHIDHLSERMQSTSGEIFFII